MSLRSSTPERLARNDRMVVLGAVVVIVVLAAAYTVAGIGMNMSAIDMTSMPIAPGTVSLARAPSWGIGYTGLVFVMWWFMMIAMMTPSAAPTLLLFAALRRQGGRAGAVSLDTGQFLAGYLLAWAGFAMVAAGGQWAAQLSGLIGADRMTATSRLFAAGVLLGAGAYQFSPLKNACLSHCRSPAAFLSRHRSPGRFGPLRMGAHHGLFCLGCCWALMALLFVGGIMNLYWITGLALYVLAEKWAPAGHALSRVTGAGLILWGLYLSVSTIWLAT